MISYILIKRYNGMVKLAIEIEVIENEQIGRYIGKK
jgi:hypothetical protein